jgi:superfamily II DNA or RNA helicase
MVGQFLDDLSQSLKTGFLDHSNTSKEKYQPNLLLNNKEAGQKVLSHILGELQNCDEFWFHVAFLTKSGIAVLTNSLKELEGRGIKGKILVSQYLNFTQPQALRALLKFRNIDSRIVTNRNFHAKGYLFKKNDQFNLIIGSSNLTSDALCSNTELNIKVTAAENSKIIRDALREFDSEFKESLILDEKYISEYENIFNEADKRRAILSTASVQSTSHIQPNSMQLEALESLESQREAGISKSLLVSATGTGKTYLAAFDVEKFKARRVLFVIHRANIAKKAMKTFQNVFGNKKTMGLYSGKIKEAEADFIFCTIQTINKDKHLHQFSAEHFDYIIIDESHRAGAETYKRILEYFKPKFLLGMTATPERTDGFDIFQLFDHNIAYEIRLQNAMEENLLCSFHYFGVTDISVDGEVLDDNSDFNLLVADERVNKIIENISLYGCDNDDPRGLIFCSKVNECEALSEAFNKRGFRTIALSGGNNENEREEAIDRLESDDSNLKIDYIFTVDIFNEGVDIPRLNQIIMLRPTQSAIIFVQQLGRGLRKAEQKEYLTVIDFIGNYQNTYLVPIALYGDTSYNKDTLRKLMASGSSLIPGSSTINFDKISRERIFNSINSSNLKLKRDLINDYKLLKYKIGHVPTMIDFLEHGSRDPQLYVEYSKSYFNFVSSQEQVYASSLEPLQIKLLEFFAKEINNGIRVEESLILKSLTDQGSISFDELRKSIEEKYGYEVGEETILSAVNNLNFHFITETRDGKKISLNNIYGLKIAMVDGRKIVVDSMLKEGFRNSTFKKFLEDNVEYSIKTFDGRYRLDKFQGGFILYQKYTRKDVFRILNWAVNPVAQNVGGYIVSDDKSNCPVFVNYHKEEHISETTKYEDEFISNTELTWMSKSKRTLKSPDVQAILNYKGGMRLPLFIKKSNDEGSGHYYMGDMRPIENGFLETTMPSEKDRYVSVVKINFTLNKPVEESIYNYITDNG